MTEVAQTTHELGSQRGRGRNSDPTQLLFLFFHHVCLRHHTPTRPSDLARPFLGKMRAFGGLVVRPQVR